MENRDIGEEIITKLIELNKIIDQKLSDRSENGGDECTLSFESKN